ncbi:MAG: hypothetical protein ACTHOK_15060 [Nocardioidaceae bacterium]
MRLSHPTVRRPLAAALTVLALGSVAACGGNDDATAAKSISSSILADQKTGNTQVLDVDRKGADCIGHGLVDKIGTDKLQKYGLLTKDLKMSKNVTAVHMSAADANAAADTFFACADVMKMMHKVMSTNTAVDPKIKACFDKALTKPTVHGMFVSMFRGKQDQATKDLSRTMMKCALPNGVPGQ